MPFGIKIGSYPKPELPLGGYVNLPSNIPSKILTLVGDYIKAKVQLKKAGCFSISSPFSLILFLINLKTSE